MLVSERVSIDEIKKPDNVRLLSNLEVWGLEPQTYGLQSHRSSQLSYTPSCRNICQSSKAFKNKEGGV